MLVYKTVQIILAVGADYEYMLLIVIVFDIDDDGACIVIVLFLTAATVCSLVPSCH
jgi:hypothetical protein